MVVGKEWGWVVSRTCRKKDRCGKQQQQQKKTVKKRGWALSDRRRQRLWWGFCIRGGG